MPCAQHRFEKNLELIDVEERWRMTCRACMNRSFMMPFDLEYRNGSNGAMFDTLERFNNISNPKIYVVIGMDNANVIEEKWHRGKELIEKHPFIVVGRTGVKPEVDWFTKQPHRFIEVDTEGSSSQIRKAIQEGDYETAEKMLNPEVWEYIRFEGLYGYKNANLHG
jgi:nicotinic acid mononucleotide adenylyltransferase